MAPIRRYLRITKYSVLEVRIFLDNPTLAETWLLNPRAPVLPRVMEAVRPLVLPKLREENEKHKSKSKKKSVKDVVLEDDFEVSIFLTETSSRHSLLTKQKHFQEKEPLKSNSNKLTGTSAAPMMVDDVPFLREDSDELQLQELPEESDDENTRRPKRGVDDLFVDEDEDEDDDFQGMPAKKRRAVLGGEDDGEDDKKKMALATTYDGFSIYGRVLCLIVKKRHMASKEGGQAMMEWISSTQVDQVV